MWEKYLIKDVTIGTLLGKGQGGNVYKGEAWGTTLGNIKEDIEKPMQKYVNILSLIPLFRM